MTVLPAHIQKRRQTQIDLPYYALQPDPKTHCQHCGHWVFLLAQRSDAPDIMQPLPWFYLCAQCGAISQLGVGPLTGPEERA